MTDKDATEKPVIENAMTENAMIEKAMTEKDMTNKESFALEEYKSLREEILDKMEKDFRTLSLGVGGITVILGFVFEYKIYELFFVLPLLIAANAYRYKAETASILNAGEYICKLENSIYRQNSRLSKSDTDEIFGDLGWENYLRRERRRKIYKPHAHTADVIFGSLYLLCLIESWDRNFNPHRFITIFSTILFLIIGVFWAHLIYVEWKSRKSE